jgi:signal transduction histidine kinase
MPLARWRGERAADLAIVAVSALLAGFGTWAELARSPWEPPPAVVAYVLAFTAAAALMFRRRHAVAVALVVLALAFAYHVMDYPGGALAFALFPGTYTVAAYGRTWWSLAVAAALAVLSGVPPTLAPHAVSFTDPAVYGPVIGMVCLVILGASVRQRRLDAEERVRQAHAMAEADLRRRMTDERLRIARELHDVLAHTVSVIAVQGGLALDALDDSPEVARAAVLAMRTSAREALAELRAALAALRGEGDAGTLPQPTLAELPGLAAAARAAGLAVELDIDGTSGVPPAAELTAYRIVQEALTNAVRHSGAASVWVRLSRADGALRVEVSDDGRGLPGETSSGMGLRGMRERVESLGGHLTLGARDGGGARLLAVLPL